MQIVIHCGGMPFNGATIPKGESLGGSESAAYFMAKELAALDHQVVCFTNYKPANNEMQVFDKVNYQYAGQISEQFPLGDIFHTVLQVPHDIVIIQRAPMAFYRQINSKLNIWWLHDIALIRHARTIIHHLPFIDQILTVSQWHKDQITRVYDINADIVTPTFNGVDYDMFKGIQRPIEQRMENALVFAARPERGLDEIIRENGLAEMLPEFNFHVCTYKNMPKHLQGFYSYCWKRCEELPNVVNHGHLGKEQLYDLISRCMLYVYPTCFEDTSNIMILEANATGTPFVAPQDFAALPETGKNAGMVWVKISDKYQYGDPDRSRLTERDLKRFAGQIRHVLKKPYTQWSQLNQKALAKRQSWADAAAQWDELFRKLFRKKCQDKERLFRHFERYSDVFHFREKYRDRLESNYKFIYTQDYAGHYERYYDYEFNRGVIYGPEDLSGNPRFEHTARTIGEIKPKSILDFGCAHGHYVMNLLARFPNVDFMGIDLSMRNINIAKKWAADTLKEKSGKSPEFYCGSIEFMEKKINRKFDLIVCGELLEHVPYPREMVERLMRFLNPDGWMLITVPYGAWESIGYLEHKGWRAHIHYFERQDLMEMFKNQNDYRLQAVPHTADLGHYILTFRPSDKGIGVINWPRKMEEQAPRETVSVCMIVRDGEHELGRTLKSIESIYDELIIGIDEKTKDKSWQIAEQFTDNIFTIKSPLEIGFDQARNETIKKASMDWIFWIDADEKFENAQNLNKYLRPNCFDGYGIKQHHFAVDPEGILKTDYPCRLFRNHLGMKFFGHVHEHPEKALNAGPGRIYIIPDVAIAHMGYSTEQTRRKRFERNFPMMRRERERFPNRHLSRFLWIRDLVQLCKHEAARNGYEAIKKYAQEAIDNWRLVVNAEKPNIRLILDTVPYYSDAVLIKSQGQAIEFKFTYQSNRYGPLTGEPMPIVSFFDDPQDIKQLVDLLVNDNIKYYEDRYF